MNRFTSRKFILALSAQVIALLALFMPEHATAATEIVTNATALLLSLGAAAGYIHAEGKVDAARAGGLTK